MNNRFLLLFALVGLLFSCDEDIVDKSFITNVTPFNITGPSMVIADEATAEVVTISFELDEHQILDTEVRVVFDADNSTATLGEDFDFSEEIISIAAFQRTGSFDVEVFNDFAVEETENARFIIMPVGPEDEVLWSIENSHTIDLNITNSTSNDLEVVLGWDAVYDVVVERTGTAPYGGPFDLFTGEDIEDGPQQLAGCQFVDFDFWTVDNEFEFFYGTYSPETGDCPELITYPADGVITNGTATGDTFYIFSVLFLNWGTTEFTSDPEPMPIIAEITKQGTFAGSWTQADVNALETTSAPGLGPILEVRKDNGVWTILEGASVVFTARQQQALQELNNGTRQLKWYEQD